MTLSSRKGRILSSPSAPQSKCCPAAWRTSSTYAKCVAGPVSPGIQIPEGHLPANQEEACFDKKNRLHYICGSVWVWSAGCRWRNGRHEEARVHGVSNGRGGTNVESLVLTPEMGFEKSGPSRPSRIRFIPCCVLNVPAALTRRTTPARVLRLPLSRMWMST